jgi:hypothetical protein
VVVQQHLRAAAQLRREAVSNSTATLWIFFNLNL